MNTNPKGRRTRAQPAEHNEELRQRLEEAERTLEAIRRGDVDGLVVAGPQGEQVYSLAGAEHTYRTIVETMNEAALTVDPDGTILFCNRRFCELMRTSIQRAMGHRMTAFAAPPQQLSLQRLLADAHLGPVQRHFLLRAADGTPVPVQLGAGPLEVGDHPSICLVASDLTELEASANSVRVLRENQQALEESEFRYRELLRCAPAGIYEIDFRRQRLTSVNDAMCHLMGYSRAELLTMDPLDLLDEDGRARFRTRTGRWLRGEKPDGKVEYRVKTKDGRTLDVLLDVTFARDADGKPRGATVVGHDITERKKAEEALRAANEDLRAQAEQLRTAIDMLEAKQQELEQANDNLQMQEQDLVRHTEALQASQERLALAASGTGTGLYEWDVTTGETLWTEQVARLLGLRTTTTVSQHYHYQDWAERVHPEDLPRVEAELRRCIAEQIPFAVEYRVVWPDGSVHWSANRGVFQYESDGQCTRMLGVLMDVTERKQAEEALNESRDKYRALVESTSDFIWEMDASGTYTYCSDKMKSLWGYEPKDMIGKTPFDLMPPESREQAREGFLSLVESRRPFAGLEVPSYDSQGRVITIEVSGVPFFDADGKLLGYRGVSRDITERKQAEEELRRSETRYRTVGETIPYGVWRTDATGYCTYVSDSFLELAGMTMEQVQRFGWLHLLPPEDVEPTKEHWLHCVATGENFEREHRFRTKEGPYRHVLAIGRPLRDEQGQIVSWVPGEESVGQAPPYERVHARQTNPIPPGRPAGRVPGRATVPNKANSRGPGLPNGSVVRRHVPATSG